MNWRSALYRSHTAASLHSDDYIFGTSLKTCSVIMSYHARYSDERLDYKGLASLAMIVY